MQYYELFASIECKTYTCRFPRLLLSDFSGVTHLRLDNFFFYEKFSSNLDIPELFYGGFPFLRIVHDFNTNSPEREGNIVSNLVARVVLVRCYWQPKLLLSLRQRKEEAERTCTEKKRARIFCRFNFLLNLLSSYVEQRRKLLARSLAIVAVVLWKAIFYLGKPNLFR